MSETAKVTEQRLRRAAEAAVARVDDSPDEALSPEKADKLLHELRVHQVELEMQNDELRRTQRELETSRARYFDLYDLAPIGYVTITGNGLIQEANLTAATLLNLPRGSLINRVFSLMILPEFQDVWYLNRKRLDREPRFVCELRMLREKAEPFWARIEASRSANADGLAIDRIVMSDISERVIREGELQIANRQFQESKIQVIRQEKLAVIGQLAAGIAHEVNNPIGFIKSNLCSLEKYLSILLLYLDAERVLVEADLDVEKRESLWRIWEEENLDFIISDIPDLLSESRNGVDRVAKIVRDLLGFARNSPEEMSPVNLNECIESAISIGLHEIGIDAEVIRSLADIPAACGNPQYLAQVFLNLLVNAGHAVAGKGAITVRSWQEGDMICASVSDTGQGIQPELLPRIFEPFFTTKETGKGTGLGLFISEEIIRKHGGTLTVESEPGKGATFTVKIPQYQGE